MIGLSHRSDDRLIVIGQRMAGCIAERQNHAPPAGQIGEHKCPRTRRFRCGVRCAQGAEHGGQSVGDQLEQALAAAQASEVVLAEVDDAEARRLVVVDDSRGGTGQEDLTASSSGADPRRSMHRDPGVSRRADVWLRGVNTHAHADLSCRWPGERRQGLLGVNSRGYGSPGAVESREEAVTRGVDLATAMCSQGCADELVMRCQKHAELGRPDASSEFGRALNVGKQEAHSSVRNGRHRHTTMCSGQRGSVHRQAAKRHTS